MWSFALRDGATPDEFIKFNPSWSTLSHKDYIRRRLFSAHAVCVYKFPTMEQIIPSRSLVDYDFPPVSVVSSLLFISYLISVLVALPNSSCWAAEPAEQDLRRFGRGEISCKSQAAAHKALPGHANSTSSHISNDFFSFPAALHV